MSDDPTIQWSRIDFSTMSNSARDALLLEIVSSQISEFFDEEPKEWTPFETWLVIRFRGSTRHTDLTESDAQELLLLATVKPEAWDFLHHICEAALLEPDYAKRRPLPFALSEFIALRLRGKFERPKGETKQGNKRDKNLYRNYFIHWTLCRLDEAGMKKEPARELVAKAFHKNGHFMVTTNIVRHIQRAASKYQKEFAAFDAAAEAARKRKEKNLLA